jgi:ribosome-associated translation inhibitor RaiA
MQIVIQARGLDLTAELREYVDRRLRFAFDRASYVLASVSVVLSDINGPRGGNDKCCRIRLVGNEALDMVVEDTQADLHVAVDRAADRAGRTLARRLARQRQHSHDSGYFANDPPESRSSSSNA